MWCVADLDSQYIEKMEEVLAVYEKPYDPAEPVVCWDEKAVSLHADLRPSRPMAPGRITKRDRKLLEEARKPRGNRQRKR